jgi:hypothetical protein
MTDELGWDAGNYPDDYLVVLEREYNIEFGCWRSLGRA